LGLSILTGQTRAYIDAFAAGGLDHGFSIGSAFPGPVTWMIHSSDFTAGLVAAKKRRDSTTTVC